MADAPHGSASSADAALLALQVGELAQAGLPLAPGLRAAAAEMPRRRLARAMVALADTLESGQRLEVALAGPLRRLPTPLRGALVMGVRTGRMGEVLAEYLRHERMAYDLRRLVWSSLAYPLALLAMVVIWAAILEAQFRDVSLEILPYSAIDYFTYSSNPEPRGPEPSASLQWIVRHGVAEYLAWGMGILVASILIIALLGGKRWLRAAAARLPLVGRLFSYQSSAELFDMLRLLLERGVPLPEAIGLAGSGSADASVELDCRVAAKRTERGEAFSQAAWKSGLVDRSMAPILAWGERTSAMSQALATIGRLMRGKLDHWAALVGSLLPAALLLLIAALVLFVLNGYLGNVVDSFRVTSMLLSMRGNAFATPEGLASVLAVGATLFAASRILQRRATANDQSAALLHFMGTIVLAVGTIGLFLFAAGEKGIYLSLAGLFVWGMALVRARRAAQSTLLNLMAVALERSLPLVPLVEEFAAETPGPYGARVAMFAQRLAAGGSLVGIARASKGVLPPHATAALASGEQIGDIPGTLRQAAAVDNTSGSWRSAAGRLLYLVWYTCIAFASIYTFLGISLAPQFRKILFDYGLEQPVFFEAMTSGMRNLQLSGVAPILFILCIGLTLYATLLFVGLVRFRLPGMAYLCRRLDGAAVLRTLALAAERQAPFEPVLHALSMSYPHRSVRHKLERVASRVRAGGHWAQSLAGEGLVGEADLRVLSSAERVGNLPWALTEMADRAQERAEFRLRTASQFLFPLGILVAGALLAFLALAYFTPIVEMIRALSL